MLAMQTGLYAPRVPYVDAIVRRCEFQFFRFSTAFRPTSLPRRATEPLEKSAKRAFER
jgi:hypothetical protein